MNVMKIIKFSYSVEGEEEGRFLKRHLIPPFPPKMLKGIINNPKRDLKSENLVQRRFNKKIKPKYYRKILFKQKICL
jgi:hypothetical protein